jgi:hypothetical protein
MSTAHSEHSEKSSWICVAVIIAGFIAGTTLFAARLWWGLAASCLVVLGAGVTALKVGIMQDTRTGRLGE